MNEMSTRSGEAIANSFAQAALKMLGCLRRECAFAGLVACAECAGRLGARRLAC